MIRSKHLVIIALCVSVGYASMRLYTYLFDTAIPTIQLVGIEDKRWYAGDIACSLISDKDGELSILLDGKPLVSKRSVRARDKGYIFTVPTLTIPDGNHTIEAHFNDSTYRKNATHLSREFGVDNVPIKVAFIKTDEHHKVLQGRTLHVQFQANKPLENSSITVLSQQFRCYPETPNSLIYEAFIPISCEEKPNEYLLSLDAQDLVGNNTHLDSTFQVVSYPFKKQVIVVDDEKVKKEAELGEDRRKFEEIMAQLAQQSPKEKLWRGTFCPPIDIKQVTTDYGTIRTTNHKGRYVHKALDVINLPKSVIWATQDGKVVLKDRFSDSGNTVVIDHGLGILSMYFHLDTYADIKVGDMIVKGNPVGTLGKTGYAKGYHLHWEMRINNIPVDPMQWTKETF